MKSAFLFSLFITVLSLTIKVLMHYLLEKKRGREMSLISVKDYFPEIYMPYDYAVAPEYLNLRIWCNRFYRICIYAFIATITFRILMII